MKELALNHWETRDYGRRASGIVQSHDRDVRITVRQPKHAAEDSKIYVMANGWTAGKNSMRVPAIAAAQAGHTAVTFEYTNTRMRDALVSNVNDLVTVINKLPNNQRKSAIGLSMGGAVLTMALEHIGDEIDQATLVAPGMYLRADYYTPRIIGERLVAEAMEVRQLRGNVRDGLRLLGGSVANCVRRPQAIQAEFKELLSGNVHEELRRVKAQPNAPFVRFMYGLQDELLPAYAQIESITGLPFDETISYAGGHARLAYDPTLAYDILSRDSQALAA